MKNNPSLNMNTLQWSKERLSFMLAEQRWFYQTWKLNSAALNQFVNPAINRPVPMIPIPKRNNIGV